jgi:hypothetical protein
MQGVKRMKGCCDSPAMLVSPVPKRYWQCLVSIPLMFRIQSLGVVVRDEERYSDTKTPLVQVCHCRYRQTDGALTVSVKLKKSVAV